MAENPYAPPKADLSPPANAELFGLWRDGKVLVMSRTARLPPECVRCSAPEEKRLKKTLYWHHPAVYLALLVNILVYAVLALALRKSAKVEVPLCRRHHRRRLAWMLTGTFLFLAGIGGCTAALSRQDSLLVWTSLFIVVGLIVLIVGERVVWPKKIDEQRVWLRGVGPKLLGRVAIWPRG